MAMAIANAKHMSEGAFLEVWVQNETVLILLLRIPRHVANSSGKSILRYNVHLVMNRLIR